MIRKGEPWERPAVGAPDWQVEGDDATLAAAVRSIPEHGWASDPTRRPTSRRALGVGGAVGSDHDLPLDALGIRADGRDLFGVNMVVLGTPPDRLHWFSRRVVLRVTVDGRAVHDGAATGLVVASGQYLRGHDVVPRGHPGDGRIEVQVYAVDRGGRRGVRARLPLGVHVPHPDITQAVGRRIEVLGEGELRLEVDGVAVPPASQVTVEVLPEAFLIVV